MEQKVGSGFGGWNSGHWVQLVALLPTFQGPLTTFWLVQALVPQMWKAVLNLLIKAHQVKPLGHRQAFLSCCSSSTGRLTLMTLTLKAVSAFISDSYMRVSNLPSPRAEDWAPFNLLALLHFSSCAC